jgi:hypothetical protein
MKNDCDEQREHNIAKNRTPSGQRNNDAWLGETENYGRYETQRDGNENVRRKASQLDAEHSRGHERKKHEPSEAALPT